MTDQEPPPPIPPSHPRIDTEASESFGGFCISQGDETFGPYPRNKPWPEIAADIQSKLGGRVIAEESESGAVTLTFDPDWQPKKKIGWRERISRMWESFLLFVVFMLVSAVVSGIVWGFVWAMQQDRDRRVKAERLPVVEEKLKEACELLDSEGFDGDPWPCLDENGKPVNS